MLSPVKAVRRQPHTVLADAIDESGKTIRALARELAEKGDRTAETWRRALYQYLDEAVPEPDHAARLAAVLPIPEDLWEERRRSRRRGARAAEAERVGVEGRLDDVEARLGRVEEATRTRAKSLDDLVKRLEQAGVLPAP